MGKSFRASISQITEVNFDRLAESTDLRKKAIP